MTPQEIDRIECAIRHIQTAADVDPWACDIAVKAMKTQLSAEGTTSDLISRQAAIDAIGKASDELYENIKKGATFPQRQWFDGMAQAQSILENLPSAQPEKRTEERTETHACDLIDRQAAQTELMMKCERYTLAKESHGIGHVEWSSDLISVADAMNAIRWLPSATPERKKGK